MHAQLDCTNVIAIVIIIFLVFLLCLRRPFIILYLFSIIQKASNALEVLREVLDAVDGQRPEVWWWFVWISEKIKMLHCICDCPTIQKPFHFHIFLFLFIFLLMVILHSGLDFRSFMRFVSFFLELTLTNRSLHNYS